MMRGDGNWLSHLKMDGDIMWRVHDPIPEWSPANIADGDVLSDGTRILPSDMEYRPDIAPMLIKDWKSAD